MQDFTPVRILLIVLDITPLKIVRTTKSNLPMSQLREIMTVNAWQKE